MKVAHFAPSNQVLTGQGTQDVFVATIGICLRKTSVLRIFWENTRPLLAGGCFNEKDLPDVGRGWTLRRVCGNGFHCGQIFPRTQALACVLIAQVSKKPYLARGLGLNRDIGIATCTKTLVFVH